MDVWYYYVFSDHSTSYLPFNHAVFINYKVWPADEKQVGKEQPIMSGKIQTAFSILSLVSYYFYGHGISFL